MTLEELLSDQGTDPLGNKVNGAPLRSLINAELKRAGVTPVDEATPSDKILEAIYSLDDETVRTKLLTRKVNEVKGILNFRRLMAITAVVATFILFITFATVVKGDKPLTADEIDLVKTIGISAFDLVKELFSSQN